MSQSLFEQLKEQGGLIMGDLVQQRRQENPSLEFKTKEHTDKPELSNNDKKNLGKTLSAFSNSIGGLLVWGVKAEQDDDKVDAAVELKPIANLSAFLSQMNSLVGEMVIPINTGIEIIDIPDLDRNDGSGYIAIWVPRSDRRPHCSGRDHKYYKRSGDSSYRMEHFDLEDMFLSRRYAELNLVYEVHHYGQGTARPSMSIYIGLANDSKLSARFPYLILNTHDVFQIDRFGLEGNGTFGLPKKVGQGRNKTHFSGGSDDVLNPGQELWICKYLVGYDDDQMAYFFEEPLNGNRIQSSDQFFDLEACFGCEGMNLTTTQLHIDLSNHI